MPTWGDLGRLLLVTFRRASSNELIAQEWGFLESPRLEPKSITPASDPSRRLISTLDW